MADLNIKITADSRQAQANLNQLTTSIVNFAKQLQNTTPQQVALAKSFEDVQKKFAAGQISLEQARTLMQGLASEAQNLGGKLQESGGKTEGFGLQFTELKSKIDLAVGVLRELGEAVDATVDFAKLGAQVNQMGESFDLLIANAGAAPDLFEQLKDAAGGTIPDLTLMSSTAKLLAGTTGDLATAMADAAPRLLEIARAAVKLDPTLGSVEEVFQSLATGIKRNSPLLIDNANITVKLGTANQQLAEQLGKTVEEFTDSEKAMALLNATLDGGDKLIAQVGGTVESQVDAFSQMETATTNLQNAFAAFIAETGTVQKVTEGWSEEFLFLTTLLEAQKAGLLSGAEALAKYAEAEGSMAVNEDAIAEAIAELNALIETATAGTYAFNDAMLEHAAAIEEGISGYDSLGEGLSNLEDQYANQHLRLQENIDDYAEAKAATMEFGVETNKLMQKQEALAEALRDTGPAVDALLESLDQDIGSPLEAFISDLNFFIATGGADFRGALEDIQTALAEKAITPEQAQQYAGNLLAALENAKVAAGEIDFDEAANNLAEALGIPVDDAEALLLKFQDLDAAKASLAEGIAINIQADQLDTALEAAGNFEGALTDLDDLKVEPTISVDGAKEAAQEVQHLNEAAMAAEDTLPGLVEATGSMPEGAENVGALADGLAETAAKADAAASALRRFQQVVDQMDLSNVDPLIAHSPPPLGAGLAYIAAQIPDVVSGFAALNMAVEKFGGTGGLDLGGLFEKLQADAENFADALFDAAGAFGGLGNTAADLFEQQTLDPMRKQIDALDSGIQDSLSEFEKLSGLKFDSLEELMNAAPMLAQMGLGQEAAALYNDITDSYRERVALAEELAAQEERVLKLQQQQQQLDFLNQQFELIKLIQENGLNPADVLNGVQLGANADPAALIDAMSKALEEILGKLAGQLGGLGFANGANFVVPPGYPNDSFGPLWVSSGEGVNVTPAGGAGPGMHITIDMAGAIIMSQQEANRMIRTALDQAGARADMYRRGG